VASRRIAPEHELKLLTPAGQQQGVEHMKELTDRERVMAWLGNKPLPARYRVPVEIDQRLDNWLFRPDPETHMDTRNPLGVSSLLFCRLLRHGWWAELFRMRGMRWCYKNQAHKNSMMSAMERLRTAPDQQKMWDEIEKNARERMGEAKYLASEAKVAARNARLDALAKKYEAKALAKKV
jgi:hypothetical protein